MKRRFLARLWYFNEAFLRRTLVRMFLWQQKKCLSSMTVIDNISNEYFVLFIRGVIKTDFCLRRNDDYPAFSNACSISLKISAAYSRPAEMRISPGVIPTDNLSSSVSLECVVLAG